ncbi:hypothetical protein ACO1O0_000943 [Amphichorda felina]
MVQRLPIPAAKLLSSRVHVNPGRLRVTELYFQVPLDYTKPDATTITLFARQVVRSDAPSFVSSPENPPPSPNRYLVYLEGGPGFGNREPHETPLARHALSRGYQLLFLDHRGTGLSTPVGADMLSCLGGSVPAQAEYLKLMRQDNTVRDCEAVRKCLTHGWPQNKAPWSIFGQSYGGFVSLSYLSMHPEGLSEVFLTGGLAPVLRSPDEVYQSAFPRIARRNEAYYRKYPEDIVTVRQIAAHIESMGAIALPSGGALTVPRLLTLGISFGGHEGIDSVHNIILHLKSSLDQFGFFTRAALTPLETNTPFDTNIIYAILHEAIYCDGPDKASDWASQRVGERHPSFRWLKPGTSVGDVDQPLYFSGENVFPFHFETYPELIRLKEVADQLAGFDNWPRLYDEEQLSKNTVPVYAALYLEDMYVDADFSRETARLVNNTKVFETNVMYHDALRSKGDAVLEQLFSLRDDVLD